MDVNTQLMSNMSFRGSHDRLGQDFNKPEKGQEVREDRLKHGDESFSVCLEKHVLPVISSSSVLMSEPGAELRQTDDVIQTDPTDSEWCYWDVWALVVIHCWALWVHIKQSYRASVSLSHNIWANGLSSPDSSPCRESGAQNKVSCSGCAAWQTSGNIWYISYSDWLQGVH